MIDSKTVLAIVGAGAIGYTIVKTAADKLRENVIFSIGMPVLDNSNFEHGFIKVRLPVVITNHNIFSIDVNSFFGVVRYGNVRLSNVTIPVGFVLVPHQTKTITLNLDIPINAVMNDVINEIQQGSIFNTLLNKIYLSGAISIKTDITSVSIPLENIPIPII